MGGFTFIIVIWCKTKYETISYLVKENSFGLILLRGCLRWLIFNTRDLIKVVSFMSTEKRIC